MNRSTDMISLKDRKKTIYIYGIEKKEGKKMSIKKTIAVFLSILLVFSLVPAAIFAEARVPSTVQS